MTKWAGFSLTIAVLSAILAFTGIAGRMAPACKMLFPAFLMLAGFSLLRGRRVVL